MLMVYFPAAILLITVWPFALLAVVLIVLLLLLMVIVAFGKGIAFSSCTETVISFAVCWAHVLFISSKYMMSCAIRFMQNEDRLRIAL